MKRKRSRIDPIKLEIVFNGLRSIADESFIALTKSAYSTNIKERRDHSTAFCDAAGRLVIQAEASLPVHIASMTGLMRALLEKFGGDVAQGDVFIANDPHVAGGTHLPDINMAVPVFERGRLLGFMCNIAHHADVGGMAPGSMAGGMTEIFQEGLRLPVVRLFRKGRLQRDLLDLILLNVRVPQERRGDYFAQVAACRLGERRMRELIGAHGRDVLIIAFDEIIRRTAKRMRDAVRTIPAGSYSFEDVMDDDGLAARDIPIRLRIDVGDGRIRFDFTGTAAQVPGNINVTLNATQASVCYALKALLDPEAPNNQGMLDLPQIVAPSGSLVNASFPAPVAARANTCQRIIDVILGALAPALPQQVVGAANGANTTAVFSGVDPRTGQQYVYLETLGGGFGGRATRDGKDGVQVHITNTSNLPVEAIETEYPLRVEAYSLIEDSGGPGRFRGGMGLRRVIGPVGHDCTFSGAGERFAHKPWGVFGGEEGGCGRFVHLAEGRATALAIKPSAVRVRDGEKVIAESPGAGGYGPPAERDPGAIAADLASGKFSAEYVERHYRTAPPAGAVTPAGQGDGRSVARLALK